MDHVAKLCAVGVAVCARCVRDGGDSDGALSFAGSPQDTARTIIGGLEGAMLVARPYRDLARFSAVADHLFETLRPTSS